MSGFITIHRSMLDHPLFAEDSARIGAWVWLLARACWKPTPFDVSGKIITLERGQLCASRAQLAKAWGWSPSAVERFLTRLKTEQMIGQDTGQGRSIITICNYSKYQDMGDPTGQATEQATGQRSDSHRTTKEQGNKGTRDTNVSHTSFVDRKPPSAVPEDLGLDDAGDLTMDIAKAWNAMANQAGLATVIRLTDKRTKALRVRIKAYGAPAIFEAISKIPTRPFLLGRNKDGWKADFDFLIQPDTVAKILEGRYANGGSRTGWGSTVDAIDDWVNGR